MHGGSGQRPIVYYTHRPPEDGPAVLRPVADVRIAAGPRAPGPDAIAAEAADADVICFFVPDMFDGALLARLPRLRLLAGFGKGYDNVDLAAAAAHGICVTNVPDGLTESTADLAFGLLLGLARGIRDGDALVRSGEFDGWSNAARLGTALHGKTLGIVGYGAIGRALERRAAGFGLSVIWHDAGRGVPLDDLLTRADAVVLAVPLTGATRHLIDGRRLRLLKTSALLINIARGSVVDEAAVGEALEAGTLGGYAADVFAFEDRQYADRPAAIDARLLRAERSLLTPHIGTATFEDRRQLAAVQAQSVLTFLAGRIPATAVNATGGDAAPPAR